MSVVKVLQELIRTRRTIKPACMSGAEIPREVIDEILENGNWAPNHGNTEPWRFRVYCGEGRQRLAEVLVNLYEATTPLDQQRADKIAKLGRNPLQASHAVALFMERHEGKIPELEEIEAVACAVQNMQLTAHAHGLGAFWSTGPMTYHEQAARQFDLAPGWRYLGVLFLGVPTGDAPAGRRGDVADKTEWITE